MASAIAAATKSVTFKLPENDSGGAKAVVALPKTPHPKKMRESGQIELLAVASSKIIHPQSFPTSSPRPHDNEFRPQSRPSSEQNDISCDLKEKIKPVHSSVTRHQHHVRTHMRLKPSDTAQAVNAVRERTNSASWDDTRLMKYNVARLREHLLKVEEEIKQMTRGKCTLELAVQDIRKAISVNQQSVSMQQKKTHAETDSTLRLLREESHVLSKSKSQVEQYLRSVKSHLQTLDTIRRALKTKISTLSQSLQLDAQRFKMYNGRREFGSACAAPKASKAAEDIAAPLCSKAVEVLSASKKVRAGIQGLIVSTQTQRTQAHNTVTSCVAQSVQEANSRKCEMLLERGQVRLSQNSAHHQHHTEEIMLGRVLGPISDKHRSVSEKEDRPLSRRRPGSGLEEKANIKRTSSKLAKRLSLSAVHATEMEQADQHLSRQLKQHAVSATLDSHTLRIRKMSLDNRWVQ